MAKTTDAQICIIQIFDADGVCSIEVAHTVSEDILVKRYEDSVMHFSYDEARALAKALRCLVTEPDIAE